MAMRKRQFLFRLFYSTSFSILLIIEILLLLISPGDIIYQSFAAGRRLNIVAVAIVYVAVLFVSAFIIATRFYTAHTQLTAIPKSHVPIRNEDLSRSLWRLINLDLLRSASIAYRAHPRSVSKEEIEVLAQERSSAKTRVVAWPIEHMKSWTEIQHPGWSSPCAPDLPELQFEPVLLEFPHLLEAKAVSLVSSGNASFASEIVELLQRPASMSLRDYVDRLGELGVLDVTSIAVGEFVNDYERSRFSTTSLYERDFRRMLENFTAIMQELKLPFDETVQSLVPQLDGPSEASSRSRIKVRSSKSSPNRVSEFDKNIPGKKRPGRPNDGKIYQASLSSGHAGDRSSDSEYEYSAYTGYMLPPAHFQAAVQPRSVPVGNDMGSTSNPLEFENVSNVQNDTDIDNGSVIRRIATNHTDRTDGSNMSRKSLSSVIWREDQGESTLPLPMVNDLDPL